MKRIAVLLGAGASHGCGDVAPHVPPLGADLFGALRGEFPKTWGRMLTDEEVAEFRRDPPFEKGMATIWEKRDQRAQELITDLAIYFTRFRPATGVNRYSELLDAIGPERIPSTVVASLNYECLFEYTALSRGLGIAFEAGSRVANEMLLLKPHGSCNFVMRGLGEGLRIENVQVAGGVHFWEGPIDVQPPDSIRALYAAGPSMPPAISLYAPGKPCPAAPELIMRVREEWRSCIGGADVVVVIGARVVLADAHIWQSIIDSRADVWYVGGADGSDFADFSGRVGDRLTQLGPTFEAALPLLSSRLRLLN